MTDWNALASTQKPSLASTADGVNEVATVRQLVGTSTARTWSALLWEAHWWSVTCSKTASTPPSTMPRSTTSSPLAIEQDHQRGTPCPCCWSLRLSRTYLLLFLCPLGHAAPHTARMQSRFEAATLPSPSHRESPYWSALQKSGTVSGTKRELTVQPGHVFKPRRTAQEDVSLKQIHRQGCTGHTEQQPPWAPLSPAPRRPPHPTLPVAGTRPAMLGHTGGQQQEQSEDELIDGQWRAWLPPNEPAAIADGGIRSSPCKPTATADGGIRSTPSHTPPR